MQFYNCVLLVAILFFIDVFDIQEGKDLVEKIVNKFKLSPFISVWLV